MPAGLLARAVVGALADTDVLAGLLQGVGVSPRPHAPIAPPPGHAAATPPDGVTPARVVNVSTVPLPHDQPRRAPLQPARRGTRRERWDRHAASGGMTFLARFWAKVDQSGGSDACWPWCGARNGDGYGLISLRRDGARQIVRSAHRVAYELERREEIPDGLTLDHMCRNPRCVNSRHLEVVTNRENILRGDGWGGRNARRTSCPRGHAYEPGNTYRKPGRVSRECWTCKRALDRARRKPASQSGGIVTPPSL